VNLSELANFVCTATGYIESDDQAAVRTFLQARDRMIYDSALWKSSLVMAVLALDPSNDLDHAEGIVMLPEEFQRPVGVRTGENAVRVNAVENYFRFDMDKFVETGSPFEFAELQPLFCVWRGITSIVLECEASETDVTVKIVWRDGTSIKTNEFTLMGNGVGSRAFLTPSGDRVITFSGAGTDAANGDYTFDTSAIAGFWINENGYKLKVEGAYWILRDADSNIVYFRPLDSDAWQGLGSSIPAGLAIGELPVPTVVFPDPARAEILAVYKSVTGLPVTLGYSGGEGDLTGTLLASIDAEATSSPRFSRLRLFSIPSVAINLRVLAKAKYLPLDDDLQEQTVRNSENCLIAYARGDLLRRGGENGAAQLAYQEAAGLLQQLKDVEAVQAANNQRIIPDAGYGPDFGLGPYTGPHF
jgi:hypothetical protein